MRFLRLLFFAFIFFLVSCASSGSGSGKYIYAISKGDKFVLKKDLPIAARKAHVVLQDGKIENFAKVSSLFSFNIFLILRRPFKSIMYIADSVAAQRY